MASPNPDSTTRDTLLARLTGMLGNAAVITDPAAMEPHVTDWRGRYRGDALAIVRPASTEQVSRVVRLCAAARTAIVPQGGNTGLCGASVPRAQGGEVVLCLSRLNRVRALDADNNTLTAEAGCVLADIQRAAADADRLFPLSLAAEGSAQVGGLLSTNAGGTAVLRYGNMRDLTLGLEAVLPDGSVWDGLRGLRKDNTGYDLKQLFIGAEGTLGIVTAAVLKLYPRPRASVTALAAVPDPGAAVALLQRLHGACGDRLTGFELISRLCLELVFRHVPGNADPFGKAHPWYVLAELSDTVAGGALRDLAETALGGAMEDGLVGDAVIAESEAQARALWRLRESIPEGEKLEGVSVKHDVSVPVSRVPQLMQQAGAALERAFPGVRIVAFGHVGDGNIHYNVSKPQAGDNGTFLAHQEAVNRVVYDVVAGLDGSISAEHGLGQLKRDTIRRYKSELEIELMRTLKRALDPHGLMNPGKVL